MRVVVAPDSFKGTFGAPEVADAIARGIESVGGDAVVLPLADGGEGTVAALAEPLGLHLVDVGTTDPWRDPVTARFGLSDDGVAVVEVAAASGMTTPHDGDRDPMTADTYGTGILVHEAYARGASHIMVAAGGSATTDGGRGALDAIRERGGIGSARVSVLTDVRTVFLDAAPVFGPQKGADDDQVALLRRRLDDLADTFGRDPRDVPGSGAAGGLAGGLWAGLGARIVPGADFVLDAVSFDERAADADAVVVGEGRLDAQSATGKIVSAVLARSGARPVVAVVGSVGDDLGALAGEFEAVLVASDLAELTQAGREIVARLSSR